MTDIAASAELERALQLSLELLAVAEHGDLRLAANLDAMRMQLLESVRQRSTQIGANDRLLVQSIAEVNDRTIGHLDRRRRGKVRELDMASVGRRAVDAYSATRLPR